MSQTLISKQNSITVVICVYTEERWDDIHKAVESVLSQTLRPLELILVVDHSDALYERLHLYYLHSPLVRVIPNRYRQGLSGARNTGVDTGLGNIVAFLDDDAIAANDWLERIAGGFSSPEVVGVGGLVNPNWDRLRPAWFPPEFDWVVGCSHAGMPHRSEIVRNFVGANMAFRMDVLNEIGGFHPALGRTGTNTAGCEETELCIRATQVSSNAHLIYEPGAKVYHRVPDSRGTWRYFLRRCYSEGVSKAQVAHLAGAERGLASERSYLQSTIPCALARSILEAVTRARLTAILRATALVVGTAMTIAGYAKGSAIQLRSRAVLQSGGLGKRKGFGEHRHQMPRRGQWIALLTLLIVVELWVFGLVTAGNPARMNDFGLMSILPATYYAAVGILTVSFFYWSRRAHTRPWVLFSHIAVLLAIFHLTPALLYETLRYSWAWKHVAITDFVIAHHGVDLDQQIPPLVAYQDWPGFFTLSALLTSGSGFKSAISFASFGPFVNELLYAGPLFLIFRTFTRDRRIHWASLWLFYLGNWVGQDYFSPQGYAFFLYLCAIALTLRYLMKGQKGFGSNHAPQGVRPPTAKAAYLVVIVLMLAISSSHQLTPFMFVSATALLLVFRYLRFRSLPFLSAGIAIGWIATAAQTFLHYNRSQIFNSFGALFSNAQVTQINPGSASPDQLVVSHFDYALTASIILMAIFGFIRCWRSSGIRNWIPAVLLTIAPMVALAGNNYGGEIVFRVYLFGLPFLALFAAEALAHVGEQNSITFSIGRMALLLGLTTAFLFSYYGKERSNYFSPGEVRAIDYLYKIAPKGAAIIGVVGNNPWPLEGYNEYPTYWFSEAANMNPLTTHPLRAVLAQMAPYKRAYFLFTRSDADEARMTGILRPGQYQAIERALLDSGRFNVVEHTPSVLALERLNPTQKISTIQVISPAKQGSASR